MKNKITIKVCSKSPVDNIIISKYFTHILRQLEAKVSNIHYPVNGDQSKTFLLAKHMDKFLKKNVPITMETYNETDNNPFVNTLLNKLVDEIDQFSDVFPDKPLISKPLAKKKKKSKPSSSTDYPTFLDDSFLY